MKNKAPWRQRLTVFACALSLLLFLKEELGGAEPSHPFDLKMKADQMLKGGKSNQAISLYERVLEKDRLFANAYYNLATAYYLQDKINKAAENLEAFVRLRPQDAEALYNLGCLKIRLGAFEEALKFFLRADRSPSPRLISLKIKEALQLLKDLSRQNPETQKLITYFLTASSPNL